MSAELRPLNAVDAPRVQPLAARAFDQLAEQQGRPPRASTPSVVEHYLRQHEHLLSTGAGLGAYVGDELVGAALSYVRGPVWVLALLVVEPGRQSGGTGSALLRASLHQAPALRLLHSSRDPRALRTYARAGFRLLPSLRAAGRPVRTGAEARDADLARDPSRVGCGHLAVDLEHVVANGGRVLALTDGRPGLALVHGPEGSPHAGVLAARDEATARDLLRAALAAAASREGEIEVGPLAPQEHWAVDVVLEAGLELAPIGPVAVAGVAEPLAGLCPPPAVLI